MSFDQILGEVDQFFTSKLREFGPTHRAVDWKNQQSQEMRFDQVLKIVADQKEKFSLIDYGCGYGALADYMDRKQLDAAYIGYDVSSAMIEEAHRRAGSGAKRCFTTSASELVPADYVVANGIFNIKQNTPDDQWHAYMLDTVDRFDRLSAKGFAFDVLTLYSDPPLRRPDLHYADPQFWFDHCKRKYSKRVALLHDYPLWEFTILVRKGEQ